MVPDMAMCLAGLGLESPAHSYTRPGLDFLFKCYIGMSEGYWVGPERRHAVPGARLYHGLDVGPQASPVCL